jgi:hypothetical protein
VLKAAFGRLFHWCGYLSDRIRASLRRPAVHAITIKITASVALKLPGATQLMQEVTSVGTSFIGTFQKLFST